MYIAIDVGGTKINISLFDKLDPNALSKEIKIDTTRKYESDITNIVNELSTFSGQIDAIGIALPGFIVNENQGIVSAANLPDWENKNIKDSLSSIISSDKIFLLHDAKAHALAELIFANAEDCFLYIAWGTGIGATFIKKYESVVHSQQVEFGYQMVKGVYIEELVGGVNFEKRFNKKASELTEEDWENIAEDFSIGLANLFALNYAPQIVWGGGVAIKQRDRIKDIVERASKKYPFWPMPTFRFSTFDEKGGVIGALANIKYNLELNK